MHSRACGSSRPKGSRTLKRQNRYIQRIRTLGIPLWRRTAAAVLISMARSPPPYQPSAVTCSHGVVGSVSASDRFVGC